jgi:hypothetical protein
VRERLWNNGGMIIGSEKQKKLKGKPNSFVLLSTINFI